MPCSKFPEKAVLCPPYLRLSWEGDDRIHDGKLCAVGLMVIYVLLNMRASKGLGEAVVLGRNIYIWAGGGRGCRRRACTGTWRSAIVLPTNALKVVFNISDWVEGRRPWWPSRANEGHRHALSCRRGMWVFAEAGLRFRWSRRSNRRIHRTIGSRSCRNYTVSPRYLICWGLLSRETKSNIPPSKMRRCDHAFGLGFSVVRRSAIFCRCQMALSTCSGC